LASTFEIAPNMSFSLSKAIAWSALLHLLVLLLLWCSDQPAPLPATAKAITAFVYQPITSKPEPEPLKSEPPARVVEKTLLPKPPTTKPDPLPTPLTTAVASVTEQPIVAVPTDTQQAIEPVTTAVATDAQPSLAARSLAFVAKRQAQLSSDTIKSLQQRPERREDAQNEHSMQAISKTTPAHVAANVQHVRRDGSFIEKVGDSCYQARDGADLRADIFSMKPVPCGEDKNAALYERIMSKIGQDR
jgi:type IV secretory pathway VirB10-like protein